MFDSTWCIMDVACPVCGETWKIRYVDSAHKEFLLKCKACKECFVLKRTSLIKQI